MKKAIFHILSIKSLQPVRDLITLYNNRGVKIDTPNGLKPRVDIIVSGTMQELIHVANSLGLIQTLCICKGVEDIASHCPSLLINPVYYLNKIKPTFGTNFKLSNHE